MKFSKLEIIEPILKAIEEQGYLSPTPIQEQAIPYALLGKDILGCAQTGTGKTAAFSIPTIQRLKGHDSSKIRGLILTPTRELAIQIQENINAYAKYTNIKSTIVFGGVSQKTQVAAIRRGVDILIATPGRLLDLIKQKIIKIDQVEVFILDEADRMLDMGFLLDIKKVIALLPSKKQTLFFSATMPKEIRGLTKTLLHDPAIIEVTPPSTTVDNIKQMLYYTDKANKKHLLLDLLKAEKVKSALVFTRTKSNANRLGKFLDASHIKTGVIHGNKSQNARQLALSNFKKGEVRVLVATDIAARGIDINELSYVFNYDIPEEAEAYVHRIGRTGRAGNEGTSISFADIDEVGLVKSIQKLIRIEIPVNREHDYPMMITNPSPKKGTKGASLRKNARTTSKVGHEEKSVSNDNKKKSFGDQKKADRKSFSSKNSRKASPKSYSNKFKGNQQRKSKQGVRGK